MTSDIQQHIEQRLGDRHLDVRRFLARHYEHVDPAVYASADVRDAGWKAASVDANAFPAGFNNLCATNRRKAVSALRTFLTERHPRARRVLLLPEDHTRNAYYLQNVHYLSSILSEAGIDHRIGSADPTIVEGVRHTPTPDGDTLEYALVTRRDGQILAGDDAVDVVLSNNDFTTGVPAPLLDAPIPILPLPDLGWHHRSKAKHFRLYNHLATELAQLVDLDPFHFTVQTRLVADVDFHARHGLDRVADTVDAMIEDIARRYEQHGLDTKPRVFVKDDAGTYGMGIHTADSGEEIRHLNSRQRQKMDKGKSGHKIGRVIVQEAVPSIERVDGHPAEPVFYLVGGRPIGAFMRIHAERGANENLNQPGMYFRPICQHRGCHEQHDGGEALDMCVKNMEQAAAELAALALAYEATAHVRQAPSADDLTPTAVVVHP